MNHLCYVFTPQPLDGDYQSPRI